jgi:hypothetical protein
MRRAQYTGDLRFLKIRKFLQKGLDTPRGGKIGGDLPVGQSHRIKMAALAFRALHNSYAGAKRLTLIVRLRTCARS